MKLTSHPTFFLDLQTTGAKPESGHILEVAWARKNEEITSHLVELPDKGPIPRRIQMVTGIKNSDMDGAVSFSEVMEQLKLFIENPKNAGGICVIHFAQFERPFLKAAFRRYFPDIPFPIICTHEIAKRLYPNLPSRGIKGLAGFFGNNTGDFKRASCHVEATAMIWEKLTLALHDHGIHTLDELNNWLVETPKLARTKYEYPLPKEKRLELPDVPGIYRMLNSKGEVLYVGKATSLHHRVNSYFRGQKKRDARKLEMLAQVYDLRVTICESPLEAALLETDEIKSLNPYYNIALKEGFRSLVFFNRDFTSMSGFMDAEHSIGPFSNAKVFESMLKLVAFIKNKKTTPLPDEEMFYEVLDPQLIVNGLELFCERHAINLMDLMSMRHIMARGLVWSHRLAALMEEEIEEETEEEIDLELNKEDIADKFERHFMRVGLAYMRSKKLNTLLNSTIEYCEKDGAIKKLIIKNGNISGPEVPTISLSPWSSDLVRTYDRMTVLTTELERIRTQGGHWKILK